MEVDFVGEYDVCNLYIEVWDYCESVGDYVSKILFEDLILDEEGYIDFFEIQFELYDQIGVQNYGYLNVKLVSQVE